MRHFAPYIKMARPVLRTAIAYLIVPLVFAIHLTVRDAIAGQTFVPYYPAVLLASILGGFVRGLAATAMASALAWGFFYPAPLLASRTDWLAFSVFAATGVAFAWFARPGHPMAQTQTLPLELTPGLQPESPDASIAEETSAPSAAVETFERALVLIVEDDTETNYFLGEALSREFRVESAFDGQEGLAKALALKPDVILTDMMMPNMNGDQLVAAVRKLREFDGTPIILLTARADEQLRVRLLRGGAQDYVLKPFFPEEIVARASNLVKVKRVRERLQRELESQLTDVEALASQLAGRAHHLAHALTVRDEILSIASHELKTPLTSLKLQLQITKSQIKPETGTVPSPQNLDRSFSMSLKQVGSIVSLVDELLDVAKIHSGRFTLNLQPANLGSLLRETTELFGEELKACACQLELDCDDEISGWWDRHRLEQVFVNLISNIIKYAPGQPAKITARKSATCAYVIVEDHGPGIPTESQRRIFDRFERGSTDQSTHGLGLGLYLAKTIIEAHHGSIGLESALNQGAKFMISLPLNPLELNQTAIC